MTEYERPHLTRARLAGGIFGEMVSEFRVDRIDGGARLAHCIDYRLRYPPASWLVDVVLVRGRLKETLHAGLWAMKERSEYLARLAA
jgi:hypothetical protein